MASVRLFVYGSLKRGERHHDQLAAAAFLGEAKTVPGYRLERLGDYLALVAYTKPAQVAGAQLVDTTSVEGELFQLPEEALPALDAFEGSAYERKTLSLEKYGFALAYFKKAR